MGLRIGTNLGALSALRNLRQGGVQEVRTFERLSSGLRINRGSDDPSGLVILEQLRSELTAIQQATENTQNAANMVNVADAALGQISDQLVNLRGMFVAGQNTGAIGPEAQEALQNAVNQSLSAIDRIAATTRFAGQPLVNGALGFNITGASPELTSISVEGGSFAGGFPFGVNVNVITAATRAQATGTLAATQPTDVTFRIIGPQGTADVTIAGGTAQADVVTAINSFTDQTGVEATPGGQIRTVEFGSQATLNLQEIQGDLAGITPGFSTGTNVVAQVNGASASGRGNTVTFNGSFQAEITVEPGATGSFGFTIEGGGARFQLGPTAGGANDFSVGIGAVSTNVLGVTGGFGSLREVATGGTASVANNPGNALRILDAAGREVGSLRSRLGAVSSQLFEPNARALDVAFENISASRSRIGDADFAEEIAQTVRHRLVRESGLSVLRQANLNAGLVLRLLQ